jgi:phosphate-selective porin OprO/OprP
MQSPNKITISGLLIYFILTVPSFADSKDLEQRLNDLEQQVAILKRQLEVEKEEKDKKVSDTPIVTANSKDGFSIKSPDESFKLKIRGLVQADGRFFADNQKDNGTTDTFTVRRARPILEGTVSKNFDFYIMPDFGSGAATLVDAYGEFKITPIAKFRGGKFKAPLGLERLQSDAVSNFTEIGLPSNLLPNREVGFQLSGDVLGETTSYAVGVFNGTQDLASSTAQDVDNNNDKDVVGRVVVQPFKNSGPEALKGLGIGVGGSYGHKDGSTIPTYKSAGQVNIFSYSSGTNADGAHIRVSPQAYFYKGSLGLLGEYAVSRQNLNRVTAGAISRDTFTNKGWQVSGNYVLTGELASYKGITPRNNFDLEKGTWGALEAVGRYGHLNIDNSIFENGFASPTNSVNEANEWGTGLNWYPSKNYRVSLDYVQTQFSGGAALGLDRKTENAILSRFQVSY